MRHSARIAVALLALAGPQAVGIARTAPTRPASSAVLPQASPTAPPVAAPRRAEPKRVAPARVNPDPKNPTGDVIELSIARQQLTAWRDGAAVLRLTISTGRSGYETPAGHYRILEKYENRWSGKWKVWMPYAMRWYQGYFIHELPYKPGSRYRIGATKLGRPDSHGCVRVNVGDAPRLFAWAGVGTPVWVH